MSALRVLPSSPAGLLGGIAAALAAVAACVLLQRLVLHPLARFPGPKLAAVTWWYMTYYEVFKDGAMVEHLNDLHARYEPVVRIGPNQLHFKEFKAYTDIYSNRFAKDSRTYGVVRKPDCVFCLVDVRDAKARRDYLSPMFSRRTLLRLEPVIRAKVDRLVQQLLRYGEAEKPANFCRGYLSLTKEVIYAYCFASEEDYITAPDFAHQIVYSSETAFNCFLVFVHFPWMYVLITWTASMAAWLRPQCRPQPCGPLERLRAKIDEFADNPASLEEETQETMFHHLVAPQPETGREGIRSKAVLWQEANNMIAAGSDTTGGILTVATFHVLNEPSVRESLVAELVEAWPCAETQVGLETLEKLPYLTAVIKESLRIGHGVVGPLPRIVTPCDAVIAGHAVPAGTVVATGHTFIHLDSSPMRLDLNVGLRATRIAINTSSRSREARGNALGLAWAELYLVLGTVFRKLELELHNTTIEDMQYRCHLTPAYRGRMPHCVVAPREK